MSDLIPNTETLPQVAKEDALNRLQAIKGSILEGEADPIPVFVALTEIKKQIEAVLKDRAVKDCIREDYDKSPEKSVSAGGFDFTIVTGGAIYDYEQDPVYADLSAKLKARKQLLDTRIKGKQEIYDSEGMEVPEVPVKTYRADSFKVTKSRK